MKNFSLIEPLEARIAPASITFTDLDGDLVTITVSKGTLAQLTAAAGNLADHRLQVLNLTAADFSGASVSITAKPVAGKGDGFVNVGYINATGNVLSSVLVDGDLMTIDVGNLSKNAVALGSLTVHSMGALGLNTGAPDFISQINGAVKTINVKTDLSDASVSIFGVANSKSVGLGALNIGGSLKAPTSTGYGTVNVSGDIGSVKIGGSMIGGSNAGSSSGSIYSSVGKIGSITIGGDLIGGSSTSSGEFIAQSIGSVTIGGDVRGGAGIISGRVVSNSDIGNVKIGGSLIGSGSDTGVIIGDKIGNVTVGGSLVGNGVRSGSILATDGDIGNVTIGGSMQGGSGEQSGSIYAYDGNVGNVTVRGDVTGGSGLKSGSILASTNIGTHGKLGAVKIGGDVRGQGESSGLIMARETIASVTIGGDLDGGSMTFAGAIWANDKIGSVSIRGSMLGSSGDYSGTIAGGGVGSVTVGKDLEGGSGYYSGSIYLSAGSVGPVTVSGSIKGGDQLTAGSIYGNSLSSVTVKGSIEGGSAFSTGSIRALNNMGKIVVFGDVEGGLGQESGSISSTVGDIASVTIGGSLIGGTENNAGSIQGRVLGPITIEGDLNGSSDAGTGSILASASMGNVTIGGSMFGGGSFTSGIIGFIGVPTLPKMGNITIGGDVVGGYANGAGGIRGAGVEGESVGAIKVGGDWRGSTSEDSAQITVRNVASITLEGSLIASSSGFEGNARWVGDKVGTILIGGDIKGGSNEAGTISYGSAKSVTVMGSMIGGFADFSGSIRITNADKIVIGHDVRGGTIGNSNALYSGAILSGGKINSITVGGSIIAGQETGSGQLSLSGAIVGHTLGSVSIKGSIVGNANVTANIQTAISIGSLSVGGRVEMSVISVYLSGGTLGTLKVTGDWIASSTIVGLGVRDNFGDGNDGRSIVPGGLTTASKIGSIVIGGQVHGLVALPGRSFGFGAEEIGSFKAGKSAYVLKTGAHNDKFTAQYAVGTALAVGSSVSSVNSDGVAVHVFEV